MRHPASAAARTSSGRMDPAAARAPETTSTGGAGTGRPTCSSSTDAKTSRTPNCVNRAIRSIGASYDASTRQLRIQLPHTGFQRVDTLEEREHQRERRRVELEVA